MVAQCLLERELQKIMFEANLNLFSGGPHLVFTGQTHAYDPQTRGSAHQFWLWDASDWLVI